MLHINEREPVYTQVIRYFKQQIATSKLHPGQEIPSRRELAQQLKINPNTAQRAYKEMEEAKLIQTIGNSPSRITTDHTIIQAVKEELLTVAVDQFMTSVQAIEVPLDELLSLIRQRYEKGDSQC